MLCQFDKLLYPRMADASTVDYMIAVYRPLEILHDGSGNAMSQFKAVGYCLPITEKVRFRLNGHWARHPKHGLQFEVESYEEVISHTREGIIGYLASGQIKGVGRKIAEKIYDSFGQDTLEILDQEPEKLMTIRGISERRLRMICDSYLATRGARDVIAFLTIMYGTVVRKVCSDISQRTEPSRVSVLFVRISKNYKHMCCKYAFAAV